MATLQVYFLLSALQLLFHVRVDFIIQQLGPTLGVVVVEYVATVRRPRRWSWLRHDLQV
jgi:hypothetical protein